MKKIITSTIIGIVLLPAIASAMLIYAPTAGSANTNNPPYATIATTTNSATQKIQSPISQNVKGTSSIPATTTTQLTSAQTTAIIQLLKIFGVSQTTINKVMNDLIGTSIPAVNTSTTKIIPTNNIQQTIQSATSTQSFTPGSFPGHPSWFYAPSI